MIYRLLICMFALVQGSLFSMDPVLFDEIKYLFANYGNNKYMINEEIIQRSHVLQAAMIARLAGAPEDVVIGLMLHDIGQIVSKEHLGNLDYLHAQHDEAGARWLKDNGFPPFVSDLVRYHTLAKVVLCMEDSGYFDTLSLASKESYFIQRDKYLNEPGQPVLCAFLQHPRADDIKHARKCDDMAKIIGLNEFSDKTADQPVFLPSFDTYYDMALRVCQGDGAGASREDWKEIVDAFHSHMTVNRPEFEAMIKSMLAQ